MIKELDKKELPETCYVFKHSTQCPISAEAARVVKNAEDKLNAPLYWINVIEQRDLADWIEEKYGVRHESPQLLYIIDGKSSMDWSHRAIVPEIFG